MNFLKKHPNIIAAFLLLIMFLLGLFSLSGDSGTTDEIAHIPAGYSYLKYRDYRLNPEHPPLLKAVAAVPLLFLNLNFPEDLPAWKDEVNGQWETGWKFIYHYGNDADQMLFWSRLPVLLYAIILGIYVYLWSKELFGKRVGLFALFLYSFSPNILAHSRLVTTDLAVTVSFFIALYYFYKFIKKPSWKYLIYSGIAFGIAQLVKFSNIILVVYLVLLLIVMLFIYRKRFEFNFPLADRIKRNWLQRSYTLLTSLLVIFVVGFILVGLVYAVFVSKMPDDVQIRLINESLAGDEPTKVNFRNLLHSIRKNPVGKPYAQYLLGLKMVFARIQGGNTTYFWGETSNQAWWYYYPLSFLIKTPVSTLTLFLFSLFYLLFNFVKKYKKQKIDTVKNRFVKFYEKFTRTCWDFFSEIIMISVIVAFFVIGVTSNLNIGLRHILPLCPFVFMLGAKYFIRFITNHKTEIKNFIRSKKVLAAIIIVYYVATNLVNFPFYLAYFNEFIGRNNAYKYTVDSNLDWGQDLRRLARWVEENNIEHIKVDYFGGSVPEYYMGDKQEKWMSRYGETTGWLAVSATYFQNSKYYAKTLGEPDYTWLEKYEPETIIGGSILVYNIPK
jgi:hypothetical protein